MGFYGFNVFLFVEVLRERDEESAVETLQRRRRRLYCRNETVVFIGESKLFMLFFPWWCVIMVSVLEEKHREFCSVSWYWGRNDFFSDKEKLKREKALYLKRNNWLFNTHDEILVTLYTIEEWLMWFSL